MNSMRQIEPWQILTILVTILGTATGLVLGLRDSLPAGLYPPIIIILVSLLVGCFVWLMVITNPPRHAYTYIRKALESRRERKRQEQRWQRHLRIIEEWARKWLELGDLIVQVMGCDNEPTPIQEEEFSTLHQWFIKNRPEVVPAWRRFHDQRTPMAHENYPDKSLADNVLKRNWTDPFSFFYQPLSLWRLAVELEVVPTFETWTQSEDVVSQIRYVVTILSELVSEFVTWSKRW
ncbi:MAG: hypothetical protein E3J65_03995 [Dehalococcoidia bacterium]|nr:MAG: hypothetical protein E3J65_03995 [Dehalococcoidia bacterium]